MLAAQQAAGSVTFADVPMRQIPWLVICRAARVFRFLALVVSTKVVCDGPGDQRAEDVKAATA